MAWETIRVKNPKRGMEVKLRNDEPGRDNVYQIVGVTRDRKGVRVRRISGEWSDRQKQRKEKDPGYYDLKLHIADVVDVDDYENARKLLKASELWTSGKGRGKWARYEGADWDGARQLYREVMASRAMARGKSMYIGSPSERLRAKFKGMRPGPKLHHPSRS